MKGFLLLVALGGLAVASLTVLSPEPSSDFAIAIVHQAKIVVPEYSPEVAGVSDAGAASSPADAPLQQGIVSLEEAPREITLTSTGFDPAELTVASGTAVTWRNRLEDAANITPGTTQNHALYAGIWEDVGAGRVQPGEAYIFIFSSPGTFQYTDALHPGYSGTVIVTP